MEDIKEKTADEIRKIAQEEMAKQIRKNIDSALIFKYISMLEEENKHLKADLKNVLKQVLGAFEQNWCIDWNFTEIREKYDLGDE